MAKQTKKSTPEQQEAVTRLIMAGIKRVESDNRYHLMNTTIQSNGTPTLALGAYQFVPKHHWNDIVEFTQKHPKYKWYAFTRIKGGHLNFKTEQAKKMYREFLNDKKMQDDYMKHYVKKMLPQAERLYREYGQRYNLRMDEIFAILHHQGTGGGEAAIKSGQINYKSKDGTGGDKYLKKFNQGVYEYTGVKKDSKGNYLGTKSQRNLYVNDYAINGQNRKHKDPTGYKFEQTKDNKAFNEYVKTYNDLWKKNQKGELSIEDFNSQMSDLYKKYEKNGQIESINKSIAHYNYTKRQEAIGAGESLKVKTSLFNSLMFHNNPDGSIKEATINTETLTAEQLKFIEANKDMFQFKKSTISRNGEVLVVKDLTGFSNSIKQDYKKIGYRDFAPVYNKNGKLMLNSNLKPSPVYGTNTSLTYLPKGTRLIIPKANPSKIIAPSLEKGNNPFSVDNEEIATSDSTSSDNDWDDGLDGGSNSDTSSSSDESNEALAAATEEQNELYRQYLAQKEKERIQAEEDEKDGSVSETMDYLAKMSDIKPEENFQYDAANYKNEVPFGELANSLAGIVVGNEMEKTDLPDYDPQVNLAYQSYISEMAEISRRGLSPQQEAEAKAHIQDAYAAGIQQITKASGGNRNAVLGNLSRLDAQKNQSLISLASEDARMQMEGLKSYGEGMKYINDFDQNVYLQNYNRDFQVAQERRRNGGDLTTAAWTNLNNVMNNYENNKPGSANHMMKVQLLKNAFNYDPTIKDNGKGDIVGSWSWKQKQNEQIFKNSAAYDEAKKQFSLLTKEEQWVVDKFLKKNGYDPDSAIAFSQYLINNRGQIDFSEAESDPNKFFQERVKGIVQQQKENGVAAPIQTGIIANGEQPQQGVPQDQAVNGTSPAVTSETAKWNVNPQNSKPTEIQSGYNDVDFNKPIDWSKYQELDKMVNDGKNTQQMTEPQNQEQKPNLAWNIAGAINDIASQLIKK